MNKIRLKDGTLMFLPEEYMPNLIRCVEDTLGREAAELIEDWAKEEQPASYRFAQMAQELRDLKLYTEKFQQKLGSEREDHIRELDELEGELVRLTEVNDMLWNTNEQLTAVLKSFGWSGFDDKDATEKESCITDDAKPLPRVCFNCRHKKMVDGSFEGGIVKCKLYGTYHYLEQEGCKWYKEKGGIDQ